MLKNYDGAVYSQGYGLNKEVFRSLAKDDILQTFISDDDFRSSNAGVVEVGCIFYVFNDRYQQKLKTLPTIKAEFEFDGVVSKDING